MIQNPTLPDLAGTGSARIRLTLLAGFLSCLACSQKSSETQYSQAPLINRFTVDPGMVSPGQSSQLTWEVLQAANVSLNGQAVSPSSSATVRPLQSETYTLSASNPLGSVQRAVKVQVESLESDWTPPYLPDPDLLRMQADLNYLCSAELAGRKTGTTGGMMAASYLAQRMQGIGLHPLPNSGAGAESPYHLTWSYSGLVAPSRHWKANATPPSHRANWDDRSPKESSVPLEPKKVMESSPNSEGRTLAIVANLAGMIPGSDPVLSQEYVLLTAHYDHLGTTLGGDYYPGADDNASGTAGILEVARLLKTATLRRSVIVLALTGEEQGLLGAYAFLANPPVPISQIKAVINLDMIGRGLPQEYQLTPAKVENKVSTLVRDARRAAQIQHVQFSASIEVYWKSSDHFAFSTYGIPVVFLHSGTNPDLHRTTDTPDKILWSKADTFVRMTRDLAWAASNADETPRFLTPAIYQQWMWGSFLLQKHTHWPGRIPR